MAKTATEVRQLVMNREISARKSAAEIMRVIGSYVPDNQWSNCKDAVERWLLDNAEKWEQEIKDAKELLADIPPGPRDN